MKYSYEILFDSDGDMDSYHRNFVGTFEELTIKLLDIQENGNKSFQRFPAEDIIGLMFAVEWGKEWFKEPYKNVTNDLIRIGVKDARTKITSV